MTATNKKNLKTKINSLYASGGTNIYSGLQLGLQQVTQSYSSGNRVCSIILLSDGIDQKKNADKNFDSLIKNGAKKNYVFTSHSFGYGASHDSVLMSSISKVRDGGYFFIKEVNEVKAAFIKIYGALSTIVDNNLHLRAQSAYRIDSIMGMDDMYQSTLTKKAPYTFDVNLLHVVGGKTYSFVAMVDIPDNTPYGTKVLTATIVGKNIVEHYLWDNDYNPFAYEEYMRTVAFTILNEAYNQGTRGADTIKKGINWFKSNYDGNFNWEGALSETILDFNNFNSYGKANVLSKLRELKSQQIGTHYSTENSFVDELVKDETDMQIQTSQQKKITTQQTISTESNKNYYYFYLKDGIAEINGTHFSGKHSSVMFYSAQTDKMNLKPVTKSVEYYYKSEKKTRLQNLVDIGRGAKFIFKKDFPFDFYTRIDGKNDILFNIQFLNLEYAEVQNQIPSFEITAYVQTEAMVNTISSKNDNYIPSGTKFVGYYDPGPRVGKLLIKKEELTRNFDYKSAKNFLYVVIRKTSSSKLVYKKVEGQFTFIEMNYRSRNIPEGLYIFNSLLPDQKNPHQYTILLDSTAGKDTRIEFAASNSNINCKVLKYNNYDLGSEELYEDSNELKIRREAKLGKTYIYVTQSTDSKKLINEVIVSIFSSKDDKIKTSNSNLAYSLRFARNSDNGLYEYKDSSGKEFEFNIGNVGGNQEKIKIDFSPINIKTLDGKTYVNEKTRYFLRGYAFDKKTEGFKGTITYSEKNEPDIFIEKNLNNKGQLSIEFTLNRAKNYLFTLFAFFESTQEIIAYQSKKLYKLAQGIVIKDNNSFENEYNSNLALDFEVSSSMTKSHLLVQITELDDGESITLKATIDKQKYEGQNIIQIPKGKCAGKKIKLEINLNNGEKEKEYYLKINMINKQVIESDVKNTMTSRKEEIFFEDTENPIINNLNNGSIVALSSANGKKATKLSILNREGHPISGNNIINMSYSPDIDLIQPYNLGYYIFIHHNKQGKTAKETILSIKDQKIIKNVTLKGYIYERTSSIPLQNDNVLIAGIKTVTSKKNAEINIYNPKTGVIGGMISINSNTEYISCYEQTKNYVNCIYSTYESASKSNLRLKEILVEGNILSEKRDTLLKTVSTKFSYLKSIPYNDREGIILFQTGKELYYCHIKRDKEDDNIKIKRYELLYNNCLLDGNRNDNADVAILSKFKVFATCETVNNKLKGYLIYQNQKKVEAFDINNFSSGKVETPVFAKFDNSLGLFYTSPYNAIKKVKYHILNYPDCLDYTNNYFILPINNVRKMNFIGQVFLSNPYPLNNKEDVKVRFVSYDKNFTFKEEAKNSAVTQNIDYPAAFPLYLKSDKTGVFNIQYTAVKEDPLDGIFIGKTCKMRVLTPKCLEQCLSCTGTGSEEHHMCLGCKDNTYYQEKDPSAKKEGDFTPHFCKKCDISCSSCFGGFLKDIPTTNCKACDYKNNYFPLEGNEKTCISEETKEYWEKQINAPIYLDSTLGEDDKSKWRWRKCHKNCASCSELGDDTNNKCTACKKGLYFFFNQTLENKGIPGTCHSGHVGNGYYLKVDEGMEKFYPCSKNCKKCINGNQCEQCYPQFFLQKNEDESETICKPECGYCLAEDRDQWKCVNCKTDYPEPRYTMNKTCIKDIPFIEFLGKYHHIVDDKCNLLIGCKEGCHKCNPWYSDSCTECDSELYEEDHFGEKKETFHCFSSDTCKGIEPYIYDQEKIIRGVPEIINGKKVCTNCKKRYNKYRLPDEYKCGDKMKRTYVEIEEYNKLSHCYYKCEECEYEGNYTINNCTSCRDPSIFSELLQVGKYYNCERKPAKCDNLPYYHDYEKGEKLGLDDCGENCDVCMTNNTCPSKYPYLITETKECVEHCTIFEIMDKTCQFFEQETGLISLENPWGLEDNKENINNILINQINFDETTSNQNYENNQKQVNENIKEPQISKVPIKSKSRSGNKVESTVESKSNNTMLFDQSELYNLKESKVINGNNLTLELTSVKLEHQKLEKILSGKSDKINVSIIDLSECEKLLKKTFNLNDEEDLVIIKGDVFNSSSEDYSLNRTEYRIYSNSLKAFLPLSICKDTKLSTQTYNFLNTSLLGHNFQSKSKAVFNNNYNPFDHNSKFYTDICTTFTNENGNDVLLFNRRNEYFFKDNHLCEKGCDFLGYNETINLFSCNCSIKSSINDKSTYKIKNITVPQEFYDKKDSNENIKVFQCSSQVFSVKGQKMNIGSYILFGLFFCFIGVVIFYCIRGKRSWEDIRDKLDIMAENSIAEITGVNEVGSINEEENKENPSHIEIKQDEQKPENAPKDFDMTEEDLNSADYSTAKDNDKRGYCKYYLSLLKIKQPLIFTFYTSTDHNLRSVKIAVFILYLAFYFAFTALFFNDYILKDIYIHKGEMTLIVRAISILLASFCCLIMNLLIRVVFLRESVFSKVVKEKNPIFKRSLLGGVIRTLKIKTFILLTISLILIALFWYYVSAFCAIFKNSQEYYLMNVLYVFIVCNLWPCFTSLIAPIFRIISLKKNQANCLYKTSQIVSYF